jgi:nitroreductase
MGRRRFLRNLGLGVGTVAVAGAAGVTWKAVDGGVFATGTGPAYAAWDELGPVSRDPMGLVRAAVLAANAHNAQPWLFAVTPDRIDLFADPTRTLGAMDPLLREMHISLGCALENLVLAGPPNGLAPTVTLLPAPADPGHIARVDLAPTSAPASPLFAAIPNRHTDRAAYGTSRPVDAVRLAALGTLLDAPAPGWCGSRATPRSARSATSPSARPMRSVPTRRSPPTTSPGTAPIGPRSRIARTASPSTRRASPRWSGHWRSCCPSHTSRATTAGSAAPATPRSPPAAAFGALVVDDPLDPTRRLEAGRSWQRLHLAATAAGLSMQPLCQVPERIDRERSAGLPPDFTAATAALLPGERHPIMTFRIGHPTTDALRSPRRPARDVVRI